MTAPRILIAGDSYSDPYDFRPSIEGWSESTSEPAYSWVENLPFKVTCVAYRGSSNWDIWRSVRDCTWDCLIVNLTQSKRISYLQWRYRTESVRQCIADDAQHAVSRRCGERICDLPRAYVWSPFPEYERWEKVDWIPLREENEMWDDAITPRTTAHHLTRLGNEWMKQHITQQINRILGETYVKTTT